MKICRIIPINIPPMAEDPAVQNEHRTPDARSPDTKSANIIAREVIKIGRKRAAAPNTAAQDRTHIPGLRRSKSELTIKIAVLAQQDH